MIKLIIQIPCFNEEASIGITLADLPRQITGVDVVEWLIIDDGSTDSTISMAIAHGVDHVLKLPRNMGLANAFTAGLDACIAFGADIIVNTDADNQYCAKDIPLLIIPILEGKADIVIGARPIDTMNHFSYTKKVLQKFGSWIVRLTSGTNTIDAPSGFRAISRSAAMQLHVFNQYTYTLETIIQAGLKGLIITSVPIRTNADLRPSRLVKSVSSYVRRSIFTILRIFMTYRPFRCFAVPGAISFGVGLIIGGRFLILFFSGNGSGHIQSLILCSLLLGVGFFLIIAGLIADLISVNRQLLERLDWRIKRIEEKLVYKRHE